MPKMCFLGFSVAFPEAMGVRGGGEDSVMMLASTKRKPCTRDVDLLGMW